MRRVEVEVVDNGYAVLIDSGLEDERSERFVIEQRPNDDERLSEVRASVSLLWAVLDGVGYVPQRRSEHNISINVVPGSKYEEGER